MINNISFDDLEEVKMSNTVKRKTYNKKRKSNTYKNNNFKPKDYKLTDFVFVGDHYPIGNRNNGWKVELNQIVWRRGLEPRYDIRTWSPDHSIMGKGISLSTEETINLKNTLNSIFVDYKDMKKNDDSEFFTENDEVIF